MQWKVIEKKWCKDTAQKGKNLKASWGPFHKTSLSWGPGKVSSASPPSRWACLGACSPKKFIEIRFSEIASEVILGQKQSCSSYIAHIHFYAFSVRWYDSRLFSCRFIVALGQMVNSRVSEIYMCPFIAAA